MRRALIILSLLVVLSTNAYARTLTQALKEMTIKNTGENVTTGVVKTGKFVKDVSRETPGVVVKGVLHVIAAPFYWLEKVKK